EAIGAPGGDVGEGDSFIGERRRAEGARRGTGNREQKLHEESLFPVPRSRFPLTLSRNLVAPIRIPASDSVCRAQSHSPLRRTQTDESLASIGSVFPSTTTRSFTLYATIATSSLTNRTCAFLSSKLYCLSSHFPSAIICSIFAPSMAETPWAPT